MAGSIRAHPPAQQDVVHSKEDGVSVPRCTSRTGAGRGVGGNVRCMRTPLRVREPQELLALIPFQLGFRPRDSAVVVSLREPRQRVGLVARVDLADLADDAPPAALRGGPDVAQSLVAHVVADGGRSAVLVVYTDDEISHPTADEPRVARAVRAVERFRDAAAPFVDPVDVWVVTSTGYYALGCSEPGCCPPGGRPLSDLSETAVGARMVLEGATVAEERAAIAEIPRASPRDRGRAAAAASRSRARRRATEGAADLARWRGAALAAWRTAADGRGDPRAAPDPSVLGLIAAGLEDIQVRDAVLVSLVPGTADLPERLLTGESAGDMDGAVGRAIAAIVDPRAGIRPDTRTTGPARLVLEQVVAHGAAARQAPALTLLALLAWWGGSGARAGALLDRATVADGGYRLARLIGQAVDAGMPPGWVATGARGTDGGAAVG